MNFSNYHTLLHWLLEQPENTFDMLNNGDFYVDKSDHIQNLDGLYHIIDMHVDDVDRLLLIYNYLKSFAISHVKFDFIAYCVDKKESLIDDFIGHGVKIPPFSPFETGSLLQLENVINRTSLKNNTWYHYCEPYILAFTYQQLLTLPNLEFEKFSSTTRDAVQWISHNPLIDVYGHIPLKEVIAISPSPSEYDLL